MCSAIHHKIDRFKKLQVVSEFSSTDYLRSRGVALQKGRGGEDSLQRLSDEQGRGREGAFSPNRISAEQGEGSGGFFPKNV